MLAFEARLSRPPRAPARSRALPAPPPLFRALPGLRAPPPYPSTLDVGPLPPRAELDDRPLENLLRANELIDRNEFTGAMRELNVPRTEDDRLRPQSREMTRLGSKWYRRGLLPTLIGDEPDDRRIGSAPCAVVLP